MSLPEGIHCEVRATRKLDAVCDPSNTRYVLGAVELIPASGEEGGLWACATDGRALSVVRTAGETETRKPYYLPSKLLKPGTMKKGKLQGGVARLNGRWESANKMADPPEGRFPRVHDCLPNDCGDRQSIKLDAKLLAKLAEAIGTDGKVTLLIPPPATSKGQRGAIVAVGDGGIGVLMPVTDDANAHDHYFRTLADFTTDRLEATEPKPVAIP